ncbi:hypothetical protein A7K91_12515 [Paenibacillus oryzae]|uniref:Cell shape determination protein CcmA n=1 Tax=Paenibacillus oryzae TaxID=1844972 RepID=A0A1A5YFI0_9BACL|nr:polymer-forming cytoskeletal protein [Paenibacillus oryzae]OBR64332.1 hypothetical protein A7K91_12515 [Paenibacillus oryzae]
MFKDNKRLVAADTLIGQGTIVEGKLMSEGNLRIEGECRGDIICHGDVVIGECGIVRSAVEARDITLAGKLYGDITAKGRLIITSAGHLIGNVSAASLVIQDGGMVNGHCRTESQNTQAESAKTRQSPDASSSQPANGKNAPKPEGGTEENRIKSRQAG